MINFLVCFIIRPFKNMNKKKPMTPSRLNEHPQTSLHTRTHCTPSEPLFLIQKTMKPHCTPSHIAPSAQTSLHPLPHHCTPSESSKSAHAPSPQSAVFHITVSMAISVDFLINSRYASATCGLLVPKYKLKLLPS